jgi:hypothetical protein
MPEISKEQLEEWAQVVYENCGEGEDFSVSLYDVVMEIRDASGYYKRQTQLAPDAGDSGVKKVTSKTKKSVKPARG